VKSPALRPGVEVVIEGNERMFPGQPLLIQPAAGSRGPAARES